MALQLTLRNAHCLLRAAARPGPCRQLCRSISSETEKAEALFKELTAALTDPDNKAAVEKATRIVQSLSPILKDALSKAEVKKATRIVQSLSPILEDALSKGSVVKEIHDMGLLSRVNKLEVANEHYYRTSNIHSSAYWGFLLLIYTSLQNSKTDSMIADKKLELRVSVLEKNSDTSSEGASKESPTETSEETSMEEAPEEAEGLFGWAWGKTKVFGY